MSCCCESYYGYICSECKERVESDRKEREKALAKKKGSEPEVVADNRKKKTYTTAKVFELLKKHPTWKFVAPPTDELFKTKVWSENGRIVGILSGTIGEHTAQPSKFVVTNLVREDGWKRIKPKKLPTTFSIEVRLASGDCDVIHDVVSCKMKH
jgi:hypothetical protein